MNETTNGNSGINSLLTPDNCAVTLIDHQPWVALPIQSIDRSVLINNVAGLAEGAEALGVPTVLSTVMAEASNDPIFPEVQQVFPEQKPVDRTTTNAWQDENFVAAVQDTGRKKLVMAGLWTEVCLAQTSLSALADGYEVYFVADASGGLSNEAHEAAKQRMIGAGAVPMTWAAVLSEWTRDYTSENFSRAASTMQRHGGGLALAINYAGAANGSG